MIKARVNGESKVSDVFKTRFEHAREDAINFMNCMVRKILSV